MPLTLDVALPRAPAGGVYSLAGAPLFRSELFALMLKAHNYFEMTWLRAIRQQGRHGMAAEISERLGE